MQRLLFALVVTLGCLCGQAQAQTQQPNAASSSADFKEDCAQLPDLTFDIGTGSGAGAVFTMLPNTIVRFNGQNPFASTQRLTVNAASTMHYFPVADALLDANGLGKYIQGPGKVQLHGAGVTSWDIVHETNSAPIVLDRPAVLVIHPGAVLNTQFGFNENAKLESLYGEIQILHGRAVNNLYTAGASKTGILRNFNSVLLDRSIVKTAIPSGTETVLEIARFVNTPDADMAAVHFSVDRSSFINSGAGQAVIKTAASGTRFPNAISITNCNIEGVSFHGAHLINPILISGCRFSNSKDFAIFLENPGFHDEPGGTTGDKTYCCVNIYSNDFKQLTRVTPSLDLRMIKVKDYNINGNFDAIHLGELEIWNNDFFDVNSTASLDAAIHLDKTNAVVSNNRIISNDYVHGIFNGGVMPFGVLKSETLICDNTIEDVTSNGATLAGAAILTDSYEGYVKLNDIDNCDRGYVTGDNDRAHLIFSTIRNCEFAGVEIVDADAVLDMAGVHSSTSSGPDDYSAVNTIESNNQSASSGQIDLFPSSSAIPRLQIGQNVGWWTDFAENNIKQGSSSSQVLIKGALDGTTPVKVGPVNPNFWGTGVTPTSTEFPDVNFTSVTPASSAFTHSVVCGSVPTSPMDKNGKSRIASIDFEQDCLDLYYLGVGYTQAVGERKKGYDTLKLFIHECAPENKFPGAYDAFTSMNTAIQYMGGSKDRYVEYRGWLKDILYLNTIDPKYYCKAVEAIVFTYSSDEHNKEDIRSQLAIVQYLLESGKCDMDRSTLLKAYDLRMQEWRKRWSDTATVDTNLVKMDTTLPTLADLDLDILRGPEFSSINSDPASPSLLGVRVVNNPFSTSTEIEYSLGRTGQVEITVFNALGQSVWTKPFGAVEDARIHRLPIGADLAPGSYFVRVATMDGIVKTLKLIKQ